MIPILLSMHDNQKNTELVRLLTSHQRRLYVHIVTLLSSTKDAEDILQSVNMVLWSKIDEFEPGTNFGAWACRTAYYEVLAYRKKAAERGRLLFNSDLILTMAEERGTSTEAQLLERRRRALEDCLDKLRQRDRDLLARRYCAGTTVKKLAEEASRSLNSMYRSLERVRMTLLECIQRTLATAEAE